VVTIQTPRLVIRSYEESDADRWVELCNDDDIGRYLPASEPVTRADYADALKRRRDMEQDRGYCLWAVVERDTNAYVGQCGLKPYELDDVQTEMAYHYLPHAWHKGYGTEAANAVLRYGFGTVGVERVVAVADPRNVGSWRVMEKAGMRYQGLIDDYLGLVGMLYYAERTWWTPEPAAP
jgi:ribosomal-protein-alanine N-acetyltransferase